jgi:hypothetical protein
VRPAPRAPEAPGFQEFVFRVFEVVCLR